MKLVYLHGIGEGDAERTWLEGLNRGLEQAGYAPVADDMVVAPRYNSLLVTDGISAKMPKTSDANDDAPNSRRAFERRQAQLARNLGNAATVKGFGFNRLPDVIHQRAFDIGVDKAALADLKQVARYVSNDGVRGAVLRRVLDDLPSGDVVLVAHSLGSVIGIDLLNYLPSNVIVRRFITIGSPAAANALHAGGDDLFWNFPYNAVHDWSNFFCVYDGVTGGRGLASKFPAAQDFRVEIGAAHSSSKYLGDPIIAGLIGQILQPTTAVQRTSTNVTARLSDQEASVLLMLHFADAVAECIKDRDAADRYRRAMEVVRDDLAERILDADDAGQPVPRELRVLAKGELPELPGRWELREAVPELVVLALTNLVDPCEIEIKEAPMKALEEASVRLGFSRSTGATIARSIEEVQKHVDAKGGVPWGRVVTAAVGISLIAAVPIGLVLAAPATAAGAAAMTGGLAAFGPGGMAGGLATLGGLAGTGAAATTAAAVLPGQAALASPSGLILRVASSHAQRQLSLPYDDTIWYFLADLETDISAQLNRATSLSDKKSRVVRQIQHRLETVQKLMAFVVDNDLAPKPVLEASIAGNL